ncbi:MAG: peptidoglycan-binding protein [Nitrosomonas sp.]|nr:peptidoglycan-binding protein [Nitrosomonas sp.]
MEAGKNLDTLVKSVLIFLVVGFLAGCGDEPEESTKVGRDAVVVPEYTQSDEAVIRATEPSVHADAAEITESIEKSLDAILEEADAVIKKTEETLGEFNGDTVKTELGEMAEDIAEGSKSYVATIEEAVDESLEAVQEAVHDGHEIVKATPDLIRKIQNALNDAGFDAGTADGKLGPRTLTALKAYQQQNGLEAGKFTKETLRALDVSF